MEMVCIVCPNGCRLDVTQNGNEISVLGNKCKRGEAFARTELTAPTRSVTTSVASTVEGFPVVSVRTDGEIPKGKIFDLVRLLKNVVVDKPLSIGTVVLADVFGTGVNVITTTDMRQQATERFSYGNTSPYGA